jgi:hypothetical protein
MVWYEYLVAGIVIFNIVALGVIFSALRISSLAERRSSEIEATLDGKSIIANQKNSASLLSPANSVDTATINI